ncbi:MAG: hypothetical protein AAF297_02445 [Planctomycetota bacterium]
MRVLHLTDEGFAVRESAMLARLEVGLADEGARVYRAGPREPSAEDAVPALYRRSIGFPRATPWTTRRWRARWLLQRLAEAQTGVEDSPVDVIHAFGGGVWDVAIEAGRQAECPVVLEVWRARLASRASSLGLGRAAASVLLAASDEAIERELLDAHLASPVHRTPWGVHAPSKALPERTATGRARSVVVAGSGRDVRAIRACVSGLAMLADERPDVLFFIDAEIFRRAQLWDTAEREGMLSRVTLVDELEGRRDLALQADVLVHPEGLGEQRSLLLDAMAQGVAVVASHDPHVSWLIGARTCRSVTQATAAAWHDAMTRVLGSDQETAALRASAWSYVREHRMASRQVSAVLSAYERVVATPTLPMHDAAGR